MFIESLVTGDDMSTVVSFRARGFAPGASNRTSIKFTARRAVAGRVRAFPVVTLAGFDVDFLLTVVVRVETVDATAPMADGLADGLAVAHELAFRRPASASPATIARVPF